MSRTSNRAFSWAWGAWNRRARARARPGAARLPARVISVGNVQAGGAGKTPLVIELLRQAESSGKRAWVLTRGYRSTWEKTGGMLRPGDFAHPSDCGDEAALLAWKSREAWIGVGADRVASYGRLLKAAGEAPDCVILDDGFQHHRLARDLDVLAVTDRRPGEGLFRDQPEALEDPSALVVWTKGERWPWDGRRAYDVRVRLKLQEPFADQPPLWLVTGVADPRNVRIGLETSGYRVLRHLAFQDHAAYSRRLMDRILDDASRAQARVALTGKDWVKWRAAGVDEREVEVLEPNVEFLEGKELWSRKLWGH